MLSHAIHTGRWLFLGAPTDAEYATWVIQKRSALNRPLRGSKTIKRMAKARARGGSDLSATGIPAAQVVRPVRASLALTPTDPPLANLSWPQSRAPVNALGSRLSLTRSRASSLSSSRPPSIVEKDENIGCESTVPFVPARPAPAPSTTSLPRSSLCPLSNHPGHPPHLIHIHPLRLDHQRPSHFQTPPCEEVQPQTRKRGGWRFRLGYRVDLLSFDRTGGRRLPDASAS
jgi:hypothetical protein